MTGLALHPIRACFDTLITQIEAFHCKFQSDPIFAPFSPPDSLKVVTAVVEPSLAAAKPDQKFQFERHGYFVADRADHGVGGKVVFNRVTGLKDSWGK